MEINRANSKGRLDYEYVEEKNYRSTADIGTLHESALRIFAVLDTGSGHNFVSRNDYVC